MPKYDQKSLDEASRIIGNATGDTRAEYHPAGGSQYGSWDASVSLPAHERMSLLLTRYEPDAVVKERQETLDDFTPDSYEVFLTKDFFTDFANVYRSAIHAVSATAQQASYGGQGLAQMALNAQKAEDANVTAVFHTLDQTQNRGGR